MGPRLDCTSIALALLLASACGAPADAGVERGTVLAARDEAGREVELRIDDVQHDADVSHYAVSVREADGWCPYCRSGAVTVVVPGAWDVRGDYVDDPLLTTFACIDGAIGKCVRLGYAPWASFAGVSLREHHLACIRMLRADYCGDGSANTEDGTPIEIWDPLGVVRRGRVDRRTAFEAAWSRDGAVALDAPRHGELAEVVARCPERFAGRIVPGLEPAEIAARFPEALVFDARVID